jgi:hypothetical protein
LASEVLPWGRTLANFPDPVGVSESGGEKVRLKWRQRFANAARLDAAAIEVALRRLEVRVTA